MTNKLFITLLGVVILFAGVLSVVPNGVNLRVQRPINFTVCMMLVSGIYAAFKRDVFVGLLIIYVSYLSLQNIYIDAQLYYTIFGLIIFYLYVSAVEIDKELIYDALVIIACFNLVAQIFQLFGMDFMWQIIGDVRPVPGLMSNINETSALYAITAPAFFRRKRIWLFPVIIAGLIIAHSRQGVLALSIVSAVWVILNIKKRYAIAALTGILFCGILFHVFVKPFTVDKVRLSVWTTTLKAAALKPIAGWGFGQYQIVMPLLTAKTFTPEKIEILYDSVADKEAFIKAKEFIREDDLQGEIFIQAHNEYVEWFFIAGLIGFLLGMIVLIDTLLDARCHEDKIPFYGILTAAVVSFFGFPWHILPLSLITVLYLALVQQSLIVDLKNKPNGRVVR